MKNFRFAVLAGAMGLAGLTTGALAEDVTIGLASAQTGGLAYADQPSLAGFKMAVDEINAAGGLGADFGRRHPELAGDERVASPQRLAAVALGPSRDGLARQPFEGPAGLGLQFPHREATAHRDRGLVALEHRPAADVELVADVAHDLLDAILERDDARCAAVFVDDQRHMGAFCLHAHQKIKYRHRGRHEQDGPQDF